MEFDSLSVSSVRFALLDITWYVRSLEPVSRKLCLTMLRHNDGGPVRCAVSRLLNRFPPSQGALSKLFITESETQVCDVIAAMMQNYSGVTS